MELAIIFETTIETHPLDFNLPLFLLNIHPSVLADCMPTYYVVLMYMFVVLHNKSKLMELNVTKFGLHSDTMIQD